MNLEFVDIYYSQWLDKVNPDLEHEFFMRIKCGD